MGIGQTSSVMLRWTLVLMKNLECYQKVQHKFSLWCEILICQSCHFMRYSNFKISRLYISVRVSPYVLCLQRLLFVQNVLFLSTRLSIHITLSVKNGIWSQIMQYYLIFYVVISRFDIFIWPTFLVLCLYTLSFILKIYRMGGNCFAYVILGVKNVNLS